MVQTILGSGGGIGTPLARELKQFTSEIRLVSRNPKKVNHDDILFPADLTDPGQVGNAIAGSEVVYVTVGFPYSIKVWQVTWPPFMKSVIDSCKKHKAKLVFFDNVYMYDKSAIPFMTESSPVNPPSKKGFIRAKLREMVMNEVEKGNLDALIARAADFYGPENRNSVLNIMVADNFRKGKKAQAFGDINKIHTFTYTPDAARATAVLGNTRDAYNQEWHVPTTKEKITTKGWIELVAAEMNKKPDIQVVPVWMIKALGLFVPMMREFPEMLYQNDRDYIFDSTKFENRFGWKATAPAEGIKNLVATL
ncbi:MAG TPA: NAD-dependent epimerase/dehydratase family protein [Bacteroidales bacterium]|nr:NAD-dependent epimerase/dehydratase family protein [Bacteroidales bacterium]